MFWYTSGKVVSKILIRGDCWIAVLCMWEACIAWSCCEFLCSRYVMYLLQPSTCINFENTSYENELLHCFIQNIFGVSAPSVLFVSPCLCDIRVCGNLYGITYCHAVCCMAYELEMWGLHYLTEISFIYNIAGEYNNKSRKRCWKFEWRRIHWNEEWECLYTISSCHKDWTRGEICCHCFCCCCYCTFVCLIFIPLFRMPKKHMWLCVCCISYET